MRYGKNVSKYHCTKNETQIDSTRQIGSGTGTPMRCGVAAMTDNWMAMHKMVSPPLQAFKGNLDI